MEPFRDENHAALIRAAHLEEENARLRRELEEARKPKATTTPTVRVKVVAVALGFIGAGLAGATALMTGGAHRAVLAPTEPKTLEAPSATHADLAPAPDWEEITSGTTSDLHAYAQGTNPAVGYVVGSGGTILRHYAQSGFTPEASGTTADLYGVAESLGVVCAVGHGGLVVCARDPAKVSWKIEPTGVHEDLLGVDGSFMAVGRGGTILVRSGEGFWSPVQSGTKADLFAIAEDMGSAYAVGAGGTILRRDRGGSSWKRVESGTVEDLFAVAVEQHGVVVVGARGTVLRLTDPREGFRVEPSGTTSDLYGVVRGDRGYDFIAVGTNGTIVHSAAEGHIWEPETGGKSLTLRAVLGSIPTMFIVGDRGLILRHAY